MGNREMFDLLVRKDEFWTVFLICLCVTILIAAAYPTCFVIWVTGCWPETKKRIAEAIGCATRQDSDNIELCQVHHINYNMPIIREEHEIGNEMIPNRFIATIDETQQNNDEIRADASSMHIVVVDVNSNIPQENNEVGGSLEQCRVQISLRIS